MADLQQSVQNLRIRACNICPMSNKQLEAEYQKRFPGKKPEMDQPGNVYGQLRQSLMLDAINTEFPPQV